MKSLLVAVLLIISLSFPNICTSARTLSENVLQAGVNGSSVANAVPVDALKVLPDLGTIPANSLPPITGSTTNASSNINDTRMQNAMQSNTTTQMPTIPQMPDFSGLSSISLPQMPSGPKLPKIPNNISIMGVEVAIPKFVTSMFNGGQN